MFCRCRYSSIINHNVNLFFLRLLQTVAECCRSFGCCKCSAMINHNVTPLLFRVLQRVAACCRVFQSVAECCRAFCRCRYFSIFNVICAKETCVIRKRDLCHTQKRRKRDVCHVCRKDSFYTRLFYTHDKRLFCISFAYDIGLFYV